MSTWQQQLRKTAKRLGLQGGELLEMCTDKELQRICNGIGPQWFPEHLRNLIDTFNPTLRQVADLHDLMYYFADGSDEAFHLANAAFAANGIIMAKDRYAWYDPRRYWVMLKAKEFADICESFGHIAYMAAIDECNEDIAKSQK